MRHLLLAFAALTDSTAAADVRRLYEVTTTTGMPHLEANLRYAVATERLCLDRRDLSGVFWMLRDASLQDCRLAKLEEDDEAALYALRCDGGHGTSGDARWQFDAGTLTGTLRVRLGGKNMTFSQRAVAKPIGACD